MSRDAFIHIGLPATGAERIQGFLRSCENQLAGHGCHCPVAGRGSGTFLHQNLLFGLLGDARFNHQQGGLADLMEEIRCSNSNKVVISSTLLLSLVRRPGGLDALRNEFLREGYAMTWIIYLRPYDEWLETMYVSHLMKVGPLEEFGVWQEKNRNPAIADPERSLAHLFTTGDQVIMRSYSHHEENLAADFFGLLGIPLQGPDGLHIPNEPDPAPRVLQVELRRKVAEFAAMYLDGDGERRVLGRMRQAIPNLPLSPPYRCLERKLSQALRDETRTSYANVLRTAGITQDYDAFFPMRTKYGITSMDGLSLSMEEKADFHKSLLHCVLA